MKPLFSVCACRILKISSCFRIPEAPWMLRSLATCVSAEMFISFSCAMSIVAAPSGRSGATNFFELIGGFFSRWDLRFSRHRSWPEVHPCQHPLPLRKQLSPLCLMFSPPDGAPDQTDYRKSYRSWSKRLCWDPGDELVRASPRTFVRVFNKLDLPTFDRPQKAISGR